MSCVTLEQVGVLVEEVAKRLTNIQGSVSAPVQITIPTVGWGTDSTVEDYPIYYDVEVDGLTEQDIVMVVVAPVSASVAQSADFTSTQSFDGLFRLRAKQLPADTILAQYHITKGE